MKMRAPKGYEKNYCDADAASYLGLYGGKNRFMAGKGYFH